MDNIPEILRAFADYGLTLPVLVILMLVYFYGAEQGTFPKFWKKGEDGEKKIVTMRDLHAEMQTLRSYFNHETTEKLSEIRTSQKEIAEDVKTIKRTHIEYEKFGIKTRKNV